MHLEPHTFAAVESLGKESNSWYTTSTERYFIIDAVTDDVTRYASSMQAYTDEQYQALLTTCDYDNVRFYPSLRGEVDESTNWLCAIIAQKPMD